MANFDNLITISSRDNKSLDKLKEIEFKINYWQPWRSSWFQKFICSDKKAWGLSNALNFNSVDFVSTQKTDQMELDFVLQSDLAPVTQAFKIFQETMRKQLIDLSVSVIYIEPNMHIVGYYINGEDDEMDLGVLYQGLIDGDEQAIQFAKKVNMDIDHIARNYLCIRLISDNHDCDCALCNRQQKQ